MPDEAPPRLHEIFVELGDPELHVHEIALPRGLVLEAEKAPGGQPAGDFLLFAPRLDRERFRAALHLDAPGELAQVVVTRGVRAGGEPREPVHSLPHDREQPIDLTALGLDGGEPQAPRLDLPVRLRDRGREPPSFDVGEASVPRPSAVLRPPRRVGRPALGASPVPVSLPGPHRPFLPGAAGGGSGREEAEPARGAAGLAKASFDSPDLGDRDRVVELDQQIALPDPHPVVRVERRHHPGPEGLDLPGALPGDDLAAGRGDDVDLREPGDRPRGNEQQGEDEDYAHRTRCGGTQRDHMTL